LGIGILVTIKLEDVIQQLEFANKFSRSFFNKKDSQIYVIPEEVKRYIEEDDLEDDLDDDFIPEWEQELIPIAKDIRNNPENYIEFPDQFDIHEYSIMERFCLSLNDENLREVMYSSIKGSGAFQRFKNNIYKFGIENDWYKYKEESFKEIAIEWCKHNNIQYIE